MLRRYLGEDKNIIQVIDCELVEKRSDRVIDNRLEGYGRISQPKEYSKILKVPVAYTKRRLLLVTFLNTDIGIRVWKIKVYEDIYACQLVLELVDIRQQVAILYRLIVQLSVVHIYPELSVLFRDKEDRVSC